LCAWMLLTVAVSARAALTIEITGGGDNPIPVAIVPFGSEERAQGGITQIVAADLTRSGLFKMIDPGGVNPRPTEPNDVRTDDWKGRGAEAIAIGSVNPLTDGRIEVRFRLINVTKTEPQQLAGFTYTVTQAQTRGTAHRIADVI